MSFVEKPMLYQYHCTDVVNLMSGVDRMSVMDNVRKIDLLTGHIVLIAFEY